VNGIQLPERKKLYNRRKPDQAFGSSHAIKQILDAITRYQHDTKYRAPLQIGAISKRKGGRLRPHSSHQSGRDIDIRLPRVGKGGSIDWRATWKLVHAFIETNEVQYIFLTHRLQRSLYRAARTSGASKKDLAKWIQWPRKAKTNNGIVRHARGHDAHIHVRVTCGPRDRSCGGR
ncbi:MAG: penicillin-insensitive murein endopeptidase, partial [Nannocystaceae bacterium]